MSSANFWGKCQPACSLSPERKSAAYRYVADVLNETSRPRFSTQPIGKMIAGLLGCKQNNAKNAEGKGNAQLSEQEGSACPT